MIHTPPPQRSSSKELNPDDDDPAAPSPTGSCPLMEQGPDELLQEIIELRSQLRNTEVLLEASDLQCDTLKLALQGQLPLPPQMQMSVQTTPYMPPNTTAPSQQKMQMSVQTTPYMPPNTTAPSQQQMRPIVTASYTGQSDAIFSYTAAPPSVYTLPPYTCVQPTQMYTQIPSYTFAQPPDVSHVHKNIQSPPSNLSHGAISQMPATNLYMMTPRKLQDLPTFTGNPDDWPMFYCTYVQSTTAYGYTNLENNQRLQRCLQGEAKEVVKCLLIHPDNVGNIIEELRFRFGRPEQLINSQLSHVRDIQPINENNMSRIIPFATKTRNLSVFLQSVNGQQHISNPSLLKELVSKLPMTSRMEWARYATQIYPYASITHFSDWLSGLARLVCSVLDNEDKEPAKRRAPVLHAANKSQQRPSCPVCKNQHKVVDCSDFIAATVKARWLTVKKHRLCFACLQEGHVVRYCRVKDACSIEGCQRRHHKLLHETPSKVEVNNSDTVADSEETPTCSKKSVLTAKESVAANENLLFRVLPVTLYGPNKTVNTYALLDDGSSISMLDASLIEELGLKGEQRQLNLQWVAGRQTKEPAIVVDLHVSGAGMTKKHPLRNVYGVENLKLPVQSLSKKDLNYSKSHLGKLPIHPYVAAEPKLLIGLDHCHLGMSGKIHHLRSDGPFATCTKLGWVVFGPTSTTAYDTPSCLLTCVQPDEAALHDLVSDYFRTESFGVRASPPLEAEEDRLARSILNATTKRINERFEVGILWKSEDVQLPDSFPMALKRLEGVERKMRKNTDFSAAYKSVIQKYIENKYARKLQPAEAAMTGPRTWYLPHFGVVNPNMPGKLSLVFDAAAEVNGVSLNSYILKGPQEYQPLPSVMFNFRERAVAVCGDIKEMFHQILIRSEDRCAQRFLWRDGDDKPPDVYEMQVMTFGAACSPCCAQHVKIKNAMEQSGKYDPRAVKAITDFHYVDDFVDSFESQEQAIEISTQVRAIHKAAGFELRSFTSNSAEVLGALDNHETGSSSGKESLLQTEKILGMYWQPASDDFQYKLQFHNVDKEVIAGARCPTKRELLSIVMSVFDPLGLLSPFMVAAKLVMREVWRRDMRWNEPLPEEIYALWERWRIQLPRVVNFAVPRFYFSEGSPKDIQLHVFVDGSEDAFAAVAYWRVLKEDGAVDIALVCAKTRCAPLRTMTIPRIELQAAVLGSRLSKTLLEGHSVKVSQTILWSDSATVIKWINSEHRRYKPFVAHRIAEILSTTEKSSWRWVPTAENPADDATRPNANVDFAKTSRWLKEPLFLRDPQDNWPVNATVQECQNREEELRPKYALMVVSTKVIYFERFSSYNRIVKAIAWALRYVRHRCNIYPSYEEDGLSATELDIALKVICRHTQEEAFCSEIGLIQSDLPVPERSELSRLSPYLDSQNLLRVYGRTDAASWLSYAAKRPIICRPIIGLRG